MLKAKIDQLFLSNVGFVVIVSCQGEEKVLPIFIGPAEAQAIALVLNRVEIPRPMTHDLMKNILDQIDVKLKRVEICDLREGTFYARLVLYHNGKEIIIDSRPSDAMALALRMGADIYVEEKVLEEAGRVLDEHIKPPVDSKTGKGEGKKKTPAEILKEKLELAIREERYEDAAKIRDELKRLENPHSGN